MSLRILRGSDQVPLEPLLERQVAVLGYGNQGTAHALNLRDSGVDVVVGGRSAGTGNARAAAAGFEVASIPDAVAASDLVIMALPDETHAEVFKELIQPFLVEGATVGFMHGFAIRYELIQPPAGIGIVMVAPKGPGVTLRDRFQRDLGIPCLLAVEQESAAGNSEHLALAWANGIGCARAGVIYTTFAHETETDLFGEQAVLCGGLTQLILVAFESLVEAGYPPELAYLECCHEVKQVADLVYERGLSGMAEAISNTAEFGAYVAGPTIIDDEVLGTIRAVLADIRSGAFAARLGEDYNRGFPWFNAQRQQLAQHPIEAAGRTIRALMNPAPEPAQDNENHS